MFKKVTVLIAIFTLGFFISACTPEDTEDDTIVCDDGYVLVDDECELEEEEIVPTDTIIEAATAAGTFTTLLAALDTAELTDTLNTEGSYTVFAPTDDAFSALLTALDIDAATLLGVNNLTDILLYHVLDGTYSAADVVAGAPFAMETLQGNTVDFTVEGGNVYINGIEIITTDIETTNGVIHVIEDVLLPLDNIVATAEAAGSFTTLLAALDTAGLTATLEGEGSFTVFAPTDAAFVDLLTALDIDASTLLGFANLSDILLYHVLDGAYYSTDVVAGAPFSMATLEGSTVDFTVMNGMAYVNGAQIVTTDILTTNGVIHVIEEVILPQFDTIAGTAEAAGNFTTLLAALDTAGLATTLDSPGAFTVFAPTDDAFLALLTALDIDATTLLSVENLSDVLLYHVLDGVYFSTDVVAGAPFSMATLEGSTVDFTVMDGTAYINGVEIITTDIYTSNGVIHVIEDVILPLDDMATTVANRTELSTLSAALVQEGLVTSLQATGPFTLFAPDNAAFDQLLVDLNITLQDLLALENLDQILLFHVLAGDYYAQDVVAAAPLSLASLQTTNLDFTVMNGMVYVNGIEVTTANILTSNGVIHVIDGVLLYE